MKILDEILLATDFSKSSEYALNNAIELAKTFNAKIILVHVLPDDITNEKVKSLVYNAAETQLNQINKKIEKNGIQTEKPFIRFGNHFDRIIMIADRRDVNLIIIGAGEKLKKDSFKLGTTAEKLIRRSSKPVLVIKKGTKLKINRIICPVDFSEESRTALKNTITIARRFDAELIIFGVFEKYGKGYRGLKIKWNELNKNRHKEYLEEFDSFIKDFNLTDVKWKKEIKEGEPAKRILKAIKKHKIDLLVVGTSGKSSIHRMVMGSVTEKVVREVPCSFITIKTENVINLKLEKRITDLETHYNNAKQLVKDGFFNEAINEYKICLKINDMHLASLKGIAEVYEKLGESKIADTYKEIARKVLVSIWDKKIESDVRKFYNS